MATRHDQPRSTDHPSMSKMPNITDATEVGYFSWSGNEQHFDKRFLGHLVNPSNPDAVEFDLNHGYESFIHFEKTMNHLDGVLRCILVNKKRPQLGENCAKDAWKTNFVCRRALLKTLMNSPYRIADDKGWQKRTTLYKGTYYIDDVEDTKYKTGISRPININGYWGWKFPQYVSAPEQDGPPDITRPVNNGDKYYSIVTRQIGDHSVMITGEVDCIDDQGQYVELKTNRIFRDGRDKHNFHKFKMFYWWIQSFVCSIPKIVAGFRDEDGIVRHVKTYKTNDLPRIAAAELPERIKWKPAVCVNFVDRFFNFVKSQVIEDDAECVYFLSWRPGGDMSCRRLEPGTYENILPDWYVDELK